MLISQVSRLLSTLFCLPDSFINFPSQGVEGGVSGGPLSLSAALPEMCATPPSIISPPPSSTAGGAGGRDLSLPRKDLVWENRK